MAFCANQWFFEPELTSDPSRETSDFQAHLRIVANPATSFQLGRTTGHSCPRFCSRQHASITQEQPKRKLLPLVGEDVRAKRVWLLLNVMFLSWAFFLVYFCLREYYAAASKWLIREACRQQKEWHEQGFDLTVSINVRPLQFKDDGFVDSIVQPLKEFDVPPNRIDLEITEGILIENVEQVIEKLVQVKKLGCSISIDDFGTGYSSLAYLRQFPLDKLKIDRAFVKDIPENDDGVIATSIIMLASMLGLEVLAEGIESETQLNFLREHGCNQFQGYFLGKPTSPDQLIEKVTEFESSKLSGGTKSEAECSL